MIHSAPTLDSPETRMPSVVKAMSDGIGRLHLGVQACVALHGKILADFAIGEAMPGVPMTPDTLVPWQSAGKPITAAAILLLASEGISLDDPVARWIPGFEQGRKAGITIRHLLTHTSGMPVVDSGWPEMDWEASLARIVAVPRQEGVEPGTVAAYQPTATWLLLGEVISRATKKTYEEAARALVLAPAEMSRSFAVLTDVEWERLAHVLGGLFERDRSGVLVEMNARSRDRCTRPSPGAGFRGPVSDLVRFYLSLLGQGGRAPLLPRAQFEQMVARQRQGLFDQTLQHRVDFGLGVMLESNRYGAATAPYGFGRHCSESAFGHGGAQCSMAFADPEHGLVVAWAANGRPGEPQHQKRNRAINEAIYQDLGLAPRATSP